MSYIEALYTQLSKPSKERIV